MLIASTHELEEQHCPGLTDRDVADLIDDEQRWMAENRQAPFERSGRLSVFEIRDQVSKRAVVHAPAELRRRNREADGKVCLANSWRTEEHDVLLALKEPELGKTLDLLTLDRRLEGESYRLKVKRRSGLITPQAAKSER